MNAFEFEITILRKSHDCWPIVVRIKQLDGLTTHTEGNLQLSEDDWNKLIQHQENEKEYGKLLGQALFQNEVRDAFIRAYSKSSQDRPLRILLSIEVDRTDELRTLHWQRLCAPIDASGELNLLARDQRVPFSLYIPTIIDRRFPPIGRRDLRALVLVASPSNLGKYSLAPFDEKEVVKSVKLALGDIECKFLANIDDEDVVGPPTLEELSKQLTDAKKPYTLLHMVCHGALMKDNQRDTVLFWATEDNQVKTVLGNDLVAELKNIGEQKGLPHLAFLCTCESADPRAEGALGGLGQRLVRNLGMPAVVAMTRKVTVKTALTLSKRFYERLRESGEVDSAMQEATAGLGDRSDITVPALFSRLAGLPLFSDRLEDRELTDGEIDCGIEQCRQLLQERAPNASVLKDKFEQQVRILQERRGSEIRSARLERQQALYELNILCNQVLEISFDALAALGKTPPQYKAECPFPGLSSFRDPKYRKFFFGRDELIKELHQKFKEGNFLAVFGESGSGKSSVVLAGLIPKLQQENPELQLVYLRPGSAPVEQLQVSQSQVSGQPAVFVVDQFEELFTLCTDEAEQQDFIDQLLQLVQQHKVAITIRSDFLGECSRYSTLREQIEKRQKLVGPMEPSELGIAMKRQADTAGLEFEEGLNNAILAEVEQERGRMPLLQYALQHIWERRWGRWLCYEEYEDLGGVNKAIATSADAFYRGLSSNDERERVKNIFVRLTRLDENVQPGTKRRNTRRRVKLEELVPMGEDLNQTKELVKRLADEGIRLVVTSQDLATGAQEVEVAHEALIQHWNTLQEWLEKDRTNLQLREKISQAALEWNQHLGKEEESYLVHRGEPLEQAKALSIQSWFFNQLEANYVIACVELRDRQRQEEEARQKRELEQERKALKAAQSRNRVAAISLVGLAGLTLFAFYQGNEAQKQKNEAQKNAREAARESVNALVQTSEANLLSNRQLEAVVAAVEAGKKLKQAHLENTIENHTVSAALQRVIDNVQERNRLASNQVYSVSFSPDGKTLASGSYDNTIKLWDVATGKQNTTLKGHTGGVMSVSFSPDGKTLASASNDNTIKLWDVATGKQNTTLKGHSAEVYSVSFSSDGKTLASASNDNTIKLWDVATGKQN
ncbi:nSTAND1 domain-containing NTPase, partial [Microcoleus sp. F10-B6]